MNEIHLVGVIASQIKINEYPASDGGEPKVKASFLLGVRRPGFKGEQRKGDLIRVETWGRQARNLVQFNKYKSRIAVTGRLRSEFWNPDGVPKGGQLRSAVVADNIEYLTPMERTHAVPMADVQGPALKVAAGGRR